MVVSGWRAFDVQARRTGARASPYYEWAESTGFDYYGATQWLPVLIELRDAPRLKGTAQQFARFVIEQQALQGRDAAWVMQVRVPPFYATPPRRLSRATRFVSLLATRKFLADVYRGAEPGESIERFELGRAIRPSRAVRAIAPEPPIDFSGFAPAVVSAVIDDGIAFAHERFCSGDGTTRIEYFWDQTTPSDVWEDLGYGSEFTKRHPVNGIDRRMADSRYGSLVDEDEVYRRSGQADHAQPGHLPLAARAAHGTHVMDLACNTSVRRAPGRRPIVAVQLPGATVADPSGATLAPQIYNGLYYIIDRADAIAQGAGCWPLPVVVNVSYGTIAGPHDGSSMLEQALDLLIDACEPKICVVLPAGNNHLSRCHACFSLEPGQSQQLAWRVLPDDWTESHVEFWLPSGADQLAIDITAPDGSSTGAFAAGAGQKLEIGGKLVGEACYYGPGATGENALVRLSIVPTGNPASAGALAPAGLWRITIANPSSAAPVDAIHAWIQRDDTPPGYPRRGRQSYFDDPAYRRYDDGGRAIEDDADARTSASYVKRDGTLNAIATGSQTCVIGGYRLSDGNPAPYSGCGPVLAPGRGAPCPDGPDAMLPSDDSASQRGLLAAGTRSGCCVAMQGTSVAAPQAAFWLADRMANKLPSNRSALFDFAAWVDGASPSRPLTKRGGGGRFALPSSRHAR
jgi:Subtilase family